MIRTLDAFKLARTKLRTRKIRLIVTLVIMSLLFSCLVFISLVTTGAVGSLKDFGKEGLGSRYFVSAWPMMNSTYDNPALLEELRPAQRDLIAQKKQLAKTLNMPYDEKTDQTLPIIMMQNGPSASDVEEYINDQSPIAKTALNNQNNQITSITREGFDKRAKEQGASHTYSSTMANYSNIFTNIKVLVDGKEDLTPQKQQGYNAPTGVRSIESQGWNQISDELLQPFILEGQNTQISKDGSLPIAAPYSAAQELLKLKKLPDTATSKDKLERLKYVRTNISSVQAQLCYRNDASNTLLQTAISQQAEINANKGKKDYVAPSLQYNLPSDACGPVTIKSDKRTAAEKKADADQKRFDAISMGNTEPMQGIIKIRVVGITPDVDYDSSYSASSIFSGIFGSSIGTGWFSPQSVIQPGTLAATAQGGTLKERPLGDVSYYAEFKTLAQAKAFINNNNCQPDYEKYPSTAAQIKYCTTSGKAPFYVTGYGNNAGAIDELQSSIWKVARFVILGVIIIAVVIMMGTLGKIIADSRRETAVFRALGAKRLDISQIYFTYTILVSGLIAIIAFALGSIGAKIINNIYSQDLSINAIITYNAADTSKEFLLFGVNPLHLLIILGLIIASGIVSALLPLLTNMRRNPIRDMRDES